MVTNEPKYAIIPVVCYRIEFSMRYFRFMSLSMAVMLGYEAFAGDFYDVYPKNNLAQESNEKKFDKSYEYLLNLIQELKYAHISSYSDQELVNKAIKGLLSTLDPHTSYLDEKEFKALKENASGEFYGIGTQIAIDHGLILIITTVDGTPAHKAGLRSGDKIICIDGDYINGISADEAVNRLRGKKNTSVTLKIIRQNTEPFDITLKREVIKLESVKTEILDNILYARVSTFDEKVSSTLKKSVDDAKKKLGKKFKGLILDMRDNCGGLLTEACNVPDLFLNDGTIVVTKGRNPANYHEFKAKPGDILEGLPIVVLVNSSTASAPEIVAGALRDNKRAIIVGTRTFGKGSVQTLLDLNNGTGIKVTIAMHYTPSGKCIQAEGITPDIEVNPAYIKEFKDYVVVREENIKNSLRQDGENFVENPKPRVIQKENISDKKEENSYGSLLDIIKSMFKKQAKNGQNDKEIKKKIEELSKKHEEEDDYELLYRKISLSERREKDLQLRTAFYVLEAKSLQEY